MRKSLLLKSMLFKLFQLIPKRGVRTSIDFHLGLHNRICPRLRLITSMSTTEPPENSIGSIFQSSPMPNYYDWSFVPSAFQDAESSHIVDFFLESLDGQSAQAEHIRRASSVVESDVSDSTSTSRQHMSASSHITPKYETSPTLSAASASLQAPLDNAHPLRGVLVPGMLSEQDRRHRRREQNRKAQHAFREKRKSEARKVEKELAELKMQLAGFRHNAASAGWTICAKCRNFYPPNNAGEDVNADNPSSSPPCFDEFAFGH